jgi:hypothetical protein
MAGARQQKRLRSLRREKERVVGDEKAFAVVLDKG